MGKQLAVMIPIGIGDIIYIKSMLDNTRHLFNDIYISFCRDHIISWRDGVHEYNYFLNDIGKLFFSEPPYHFVDKCGNLLNGQEIESAFHLPLIHPNLKNILCDPNYTHGLNNYIIINTKVRQFSPQSYNLIKQTFWKEINRILKTRKIVIIGEREIEYNEEYRLLRSTIWNLYPEIINNISTNRIIDMTIPKLGITPPALLQIRKDCCILRDADYTINIGIGGSFAMAAGSSDRFLAVREDDEEICRRLYGAHCDQPRFFITTDKNKFLQKLGTI